LAGLIIGYAAVRIQPHGNFNIRPDLKDGSILITEGIYRYIRHPMYLSVLTSTLGLAIFYGGYLKMAVYAILLINMLLKLFYEEKLWRQHGDEYRQYSQGTKRLIPFLF
jgi:protein-S-isoprenylcysteine O-methyltransferase Ste14